MRIAIDYNAALRQNAGIGRYTRELVRAFLQLGNNHELVLFYASRDLTPGHAGVRALAALQVEFPQIRAVPIPLSERWLTILWQRARLPLAVERLTGAVDIIHAPDFVLPPVKQTPTLLTVHDLTFRIHPETAHANLRRYLDQAVPRSLSRAAHVLADSISTKQDLQRLMHVPADKITVLYPGIHPQFKRVTDVQRLQAVQSKFALPKQFLFFIGTLEPRKNLERLMQAFEQVRQRLGFAPDELQLLLGGKPGWLSEPILERARQTQGVRLLGPIDDDDLPTLYSLARATVYPSLYEGFGFPALESLACGTPAIVANTSSLPELVGDLGVMVEPGSIDSIAVGLEAVLTDDRFAQDALQHGPTQAAPFSWQTAAQQLEALYRQLSR